MAKYVELARRNCGSQEVELFLSDAESVSSRDIGGRRWVVDPIRFGAARDTDGGRSMEEK